jgi:TonB family protein
VAHEKWIIARRVRFVFALLLLSAPALADGTAQLDKPPKLSRFVEAEPPAALAERGQVDVVLTLDVDETGKVQKVAVAQSGGAEFDEAAVAAAKQFVFEPGEAGGKAVPVRITYQYRFLFKPPPPPVESAPEAPKPPTATIAGRVLRAGDRQPLGGLNIIVDESSVATTTNAAGKFALEVPVGAHVIHVVGPEIAKSDFKVTLQKGQKLTATWYVLGRERYTSTVRGQRAVVEAVEQTLSGEELRRIPGTQGDTLKAVQNLPGVARAPFGGGQIIVWGSAPQDTRTYVDGVFIPTLYHFGGLRSTVNSEIVSGLQFLPGGYGVEHSRGLGGVIEVETRNPRADGYHGFVQIDLIDGSLQIEGPITKNLSFTVGARRSWIDVFLPIFTTNDFQLTPIYYDYQAKLRWRASPRDDVEVFIFGSDDVLHVVSKGSADPTLQAEFDSHIYYHRILARWQHRFVSRATLTVTPSIGYDVPFQFKATIGNNMFAVDAETFEYNLRAALRQPLGRRLRLDVGVDLEGNRWTASANGPSRGMPREGDRGGGFGGAYTYDKLTLDQITFAPFVALHFTPIKNLLITPQFRLDIYDFRGYQNTPTAYDHSYVLPEPRVSLRYQITKWAAVKAAIGAYHQVPDPGSFLQAFGNPSVIPLSGWHYVVGAEFEPTPTLHIEAQGFYKDLQNLVVRGSGIHDPILTNEGMGRVYGGELLIRQELFRGFFGWVAYTISRSERKDHPGDPWRLFQYDQTHILTIIGSYKFGRGYQVGLRFRYVTGNPYTPRIGAYYDVNGDVYIPINGPLYSSRLSSFNQLDIRFDKKWTFHRWAISIYLDLQNVYRASNEEGKAPNFDYTQFASIAGLPFLPVLGIRGDF